MHLVDVLLRCWCGIVEVWVRCRLRCGKGTVGTVSSIGVDRNKCKRGVYGSTWCRRQLVGDVRVDQFACGCSG